jgi:hypothetical protein
MNLALAIDSQFKNHINDLIQQINPCVVLQSTESNTLQAMSGMALNLEVKMFLENLAVDYVLYATNLDVKFDTFKQLAKFDGATYNSIWYTQTVEHDNYHLPRLIRISKSGNFYCSPKVFSILGSAHKVDAQTSVLQNFISKCGGQGNEDFIAVHYLTERIGVTGHCLP